jgi:hypothetical protein
VAEFYDVRGGAIQAVNNYYDAEAFRQTFAMDLDSS